MEGKLNLLNIAQPELESWMMEAGFERYRARQVFQWLYQKSLKDFDQMTDLPKVLREALKEKFYLQLPKVIAEKRSEDGTVKFLLELEDGLQIEAVLIPDQEQKQNTLCLSSQVGCKYGCGFCYTGTLPFKRSLKSGEILGQYFAILRGLRKGSEIHRLVFMGMGEPLDNFEELRRALSIFTASQGLNLSPRRITISTAGVIPLIDSVWNLGVNLAVSLNSPDQEKRAQLMPISKKYPLQDLIKSLKELDSSARQKLTIEYVMLKGFNDGIEEAHKLARLLSGMKVMINLIRFNPFPGCRFEPAEEEQLFLFQEELKRAGFLVFIRKSKGADILAACGQLRGKG